MSDAPEVTFDAPVKKKKPAKKAKARVFAPAKPSAPFPGLTRAGGCADACSVKACAISGKPYCGHPTKGGLQPDEMGDPAALKRIQAARDQIDVKLDTDRFK